MRELIQEIHDLIGKPEDIVALASKEHARVLICSDSHGRSSVIIDIIKTLGKTCDAFAFCGDGAGDVVQALLLAQKDEEFNQCLPPVIAMVRGNGDPSSYPIGEGMYLSIPNMQILTVNGRNLMFVHGHREGVDFGMENYGMEMQLNECKEGFYGHTHIAREENCPDVRGNGFYKFANPGSCSRPRGGQPAGFAIATVEKNFVDVAFMKINEQTSSELQVCTWVPAYY